MTIDKLPARPTLLWLACIATISCSTSTEDVHITLCKDLIGTVTQSAPTSWTSVESKYGRFTDLKIEISYTQGSEATAEHAVCTYEKDRNVDENILTDTNPLAAYRTRPSSMSINDRELPQEALFKAINDTLKGNAKELAVEIEKGAREALQTK